jgi:cell division protein FtsQ
MSEGFIFSDDALEEEEARFPVRMDRRLKGLIVALSLVLTGELVWLLGITPCMPLSVVDVQGIPELDRALVLAQANIGLHSSYMTVDTEAAELSLEALYQVESARVVKQFPDTVKIHLEPRKAVAQSLAAINGRLEPVYFDKYGVVFQIGGGGQIYGIDTSTLPIISGLVFENAALGMRLPSAFNGFLSDIGRINSTDPQLLAAISEIQVNRKPYDSFELVLYPVHYPIKIRVGNELSQDMLRYMLLLIDVFIEQGVAVGEVDFRTGTASYIL